MSVVTPKMYIKIYSGSTLKYQGTDVISFKVTKPVTASIGSFELRLPHSTGSILSDFSAFSDIEGFYDVYIYFGTSATGSSPEFIGRIDNIKSDFSSRGYTLTLVGRDLGEALFRYKSNKDYFGYYRRYFTGSRGSTEAGKDVYVLTEQPGPLDNTGSTVVVGTNVVGSMFRLKPYATINTSFGTFPGDSYPVVIQYTGSVTDESFTTTGSDFKIYMRLFNVAAQSHSGQLLANLWYADNTGSLSNAVSMTSWTASDTIVFPAYINITRDATINLTVANRVPTKYVYAEFIWKVLTQGSDATSAFHAEMARASFLDIPNDDGLATNVIKDLILGTGISTGSVTWDDTPITKSYKDKRIFDALLEIHNIIGQDFYIDTGSLLQSFARQSQTASGTLTTGSNIFSFTKTVDITPIKNYVDVKGAAESFLPWDQDYWTEYSGSGWTLTTGLLYEAHHRADFGAQVGTKYIQAWPHVTSVQMVFGHEVNPNIDLTDDEFTDLDFYCSGGEPLPVGNGWSAAGSFVNIRLKKSASNNNDYFEAAVKTIGNIATFGANNYTLGPTNTTGSAQSGDWTKHGDINWKDVSYIEFTGSTASSQADSSFRLDGLRFSPIRWTGSASDAGSSGSYGYRPYKEVTDYFHSHDECGDRAKEILSGSTNPVTQLSITTTGSEGILQGERILVNLPSENITNQYFDIIELTHRFDPLGGYRTDLQLSDEEYIRDVTKLRDYGVENAVSMKYLDEALRGNVVRR